MKNSEFSIIILAAGASERFGKPKQLLRFEKTTLLERIAQTALKTGFEIVVVLGANAEIIQVSLENLSVRIAVNENWQTGMSSSIIKGLKKSLETNPDLAGVILLLCDQPFVTEENISKLVETQKETGKPIVASSYENTIGVPTLFMREVFDELLKLKGDTGAKPLIKRRAENLAKVNAPEAAFDVDTAEDFEALKRRATDQINFSR